MKNKFYRIYWSKEFDWNEYAKRYNKYCKTKNNYYRQSAQILINNSDIKDNLIVLDLGCGTGAMTKQILDKYKVKIIANDLSKEALEYYKKNFEKEISDGEIKIVEGNAEKISDYISEKIDIVFISSALWDMELESLFSNIKEILNQDGIIIANLPSLTIGKNKGFIYEIEKFFKKKAKIDKLYRRISINNLKKILRKNNLVAYKTIPYSFNLQKENIRKFFDVLKYRYPFIFFPDKINYKERYEKCRILFKELLKEIPSKGLREEGIIICINKLKGGSKNLYSSKN